MVPWFPVARQLMAASTYSAIMYLSPYTQYYIRKLLRQYVSYFNYPLSGVGISAYFHTDLFQLLKRIYPKGFEFRVKVRELETLVYLHQNSDTNKLYPSENATDIEQKILWLLGLKFLALLPAMSVKIVPESAASLFHFVLDAQIHQGIRYIDELYGLVLEFQAEQNLQAYRLLLKLIDQKVPFILTVSESRHGIWVNLRSPTYYSLFQDIAPVQKIA